MKSASSLPALMTFVLAVAVIATAWPWSDVASYPRDQITKKSGRLHPALQVMLEKPAQNDRCQKSPFFVALAAIGQKPKGFTRPDEGYAVPIGTGRNRLIVAILRGESNCIPGEDTQWLILFSKEGRVLDRLSCSISNRLRMFVEYSWTFRTDLLEPADSDGASLVIRCFPPAGEAFEGNWSHEIDHGGKTWTFHWDQDRPKAIPLLEWTTKGLCRIAIQGNKFKVLFPNK